VSTLVTHRTSLRAMGAPDVLAWEAVTLPDPGPGEVRLSQRAIGVNFIDVYHRTGAYPLPLPSGLGYEAAGVVEALGPGVTGLEVGQRVAYADGPAGAYAQARLFPAARLVPLPDAVGDEAAAALLFKGLTAHMLVRRVRPAAGSWALVHAAAGGVGLVLTRWLAHEGVQVIGVVSSEAKAAAARRAGAAATLVAPRGSDPGLVPPQVRALTGGAGVAVVYDSVGRDTFEASLDSLAPFGLLASFGRASGPVPPVDPALLARRGSLGFQRLSVFDHVAEPASLRAAAREVFEALAAGVLEVEIHGRYPLAEAARAHAELESRASSGSLILVP